MQKRRNLKNFANNDYYVLDDGLDKLSEIEVDVCQSRLIPSYPFFHQTYELLGYTWRKKSMSEDEPFIGCILSRSNKQKV